MFDSGGIGDLKVQPDEVDGLRAEPLDLEQLQHRRAVFFEKLGMLLQVALVHDLAQVGGHAFADTGNFQQLFGVLDQFGDLLRQGFNGFGGIAIGAYAKRILTGNLHQIGGLEQDIGDALVVHL